MTIIDCEEEPNDDIDGAGCVNCKHVGGIVLHYCMNRQSGFYGDFVDWEGYCPHYALADLWPEAPTLKSPEQTP